MRSNRETALLPPELLWLCAALPLLTLPLFVRGLFHLPATEVARELVGLCVPFVTLTLVFELLYWHVVPRLLPRFHGAGRGVFHVVLVVLVASAVSTALLPLLTFIRADALDPRSFALVCVLISLFLVLPSLLFQTQRRQRWEAEQRARKERERALSAQLKSLESRTSPHFLFNSLNTVASLIGSDPAQAEETLERLSEVLRYSLEAPRQSRVPLAKELEVVRAYLTVQGQRFAGRLRTLVEVDPGTESALVPPWLLQPLVENAVLHGLAKRSGGEVRVRTRAVAGAVEIEVEDDGPGPGQSGRTGTGTALQDLKDRVRLVCGADASVELLPGPSGKGALARVRIPR